MATFLTGAAVAVAGVLAGHTSSDRPHTALVVDASAGRDGRELVDSRLRQADAQVRLPRTGAEARMDVRYFDAQGYRVVVTGPTATEAARATGVPAQRADDLTTALAAVRR